jgi:signal transduction histidine kinase
MQAASLTQPDAGARRGFGGRGRSHVEPAIWMAAMAVLIGATIIGQVGETGARLTLDIAVGAVSVLLVPLLRRWPVQVTVVLSVLATLSPAATPAATMALLVVAERLPLPVTAALAGTGIAAHLIRELWRPVHGLPYVWWAVLTGLAYAACLGWGTLLRAHRELVGSLRQRAEQAEAEQVRRVAEARSAERARIAREMHDVLAHRLSLLATYAGALSYRPDAPPEQLSRAAEVVRSGAHQALAELREVIGLLRDDEMPDLSAGSRPLPGLADLTLLIEESRAAGMRVAVDGTDDVALPDVPAALGRTAYRVVQEGLTNARKHAPGEAVSVTLGAEPGTGLRVELANRLRDGHRDGDGGGDGGGDDGGALVPGAGTGLIGLAERLELAGGHLESRAVDGEFRLRAWLPWPEPE